MAHNVNLPGGQHQLAYITALEKAFLRNQGPYANELQGALPTFNGIDVMRNPGEARGEATGADAGGEGVLGVATAGTGRSGYGSHSRDLVWSLLDSDKYDIKIAPTRWGDCPETGLEGNLNIPSITQESFIPSPSGEKALGIKNDWTNNSDSLDIT